MGLPILSRFLLTQLLVELNFQPFFNIFVCTFGTGYGIEHIGSASYFSSESAGSVLQGPIISSKSTLIFCNNLGN